jgi:hypothetical protein
VRRHRPLAAAAFCAAAAAANAADAPFLALPVDCRLGETCFIQQYVDRDPGPAARDYTCGPLVYDGHQGTDFALPTLAAMQAGVAVLAPAAGRVRAIRDGVPDIAVDDPAAPPLDGRDCGNGLAIDHGNGWESQLCHLRQGSVRVRAGDAVAQGDAVGLVGLSGRTAFPHVHLTLRRAGTVVDPFHPADANACPSAPADSLWFDPPAYRPGGIVAAGLAADPPGWEAVKAGLPDAAALPADGPALVVWAHLFGTRAGDRLRLRITGPDGATVSDSEAVIERTQARSYRFAGRRTPAAGWPPGPYAATVELWRGERRIDTATTRARLGH